MNPLRNPNINYRKGWFFITFQVAHNKTVFGVVADRKLTLNALGRMVDENLRNLGTVFPELFIDTSMVMPNHVHAVVKIDSAEHDLSWFVGRFKSFTANQYQKMVKAGECVDIGPSLWQGNYYDNLVSSHDELENVRRYTMQNPERWEDDRFGPVTTYVLGNVELLNGSLAAFVASDTRDNWRTEKPRMRTVREWLGREPIGREAPLVSTFTSFEEQGALARRLAEKRPFIWVDPAGIKANLPAAVRAACDEGWGLVISPVPSGTGVNKQRAVWCNRWVLKVAARIYVGSVKKGGTLEALLPPARRPGATIEKQGGWGDKR